MYPRLLLRRLFVPLRLFVFLLLLFLFLGRGVHLFLHRALRFHRGRSALGLQTIAGRRRLRPLRRLGPRGLGLAIRLSCRLTVWNRRFGPTVGLHCRRTVGLHTVRFRLVIRRRPIRLSSVVLSMRSRRIDRWLNCGTIGRRIVRRPSLFRRYDCAVVQCSRLRGSSDWGCAAVRGSP